MSTADIVSVVVAAVAVAATVVLVVLLGRRSRSGRDDPAWPAPDTTTAPPMVSIRLLRSPTDELVWRLAVPPGAPAATIDILTYRPHGSAGSWCHELMEAPLPVASATHQDLDGPSPSPETEFDVCLGWTTLDTAGSRYVTLHVDPME